MPGAHASVVLGVASYSKDTSRSQQGDCGEWHDGGIRQARSDDTGLSCRRGSRGTGFGSPDREREGDAPRNHARAARQSGITSLTIAYSIVYSTQAQREYRTHAQEYFSLAAACYLYLDQGWMRPASRMVCMLPFAVAIWADRVPHPARMIAPSEASPYGKLHAAASALF